MIRLLIVDDEPSMRKGLRMRLELEPDLIVAGEAVDGRDALTQIEALAPDVVVMDVEMPDLDGLAATADLRPRAPNSSVVILSIHDDPTTRARAAEVGATAFVAKSDGDAALVAAIRATANDREPP